MEEKNYEIKKEKISEYINSNIYVPLKKKELMAILDIPKIDENIFDKMLVELIDEGKIYLTTNNKYISSKDARIYLGEYIAKSKNFGFVRVLSNEVPDMFVSSDNNKDAMNGDKVLVRMTRAKTETKSAEGTIEKITVRKNLNVVGNFTLNQNFGFVVPDDKTLKGDIYISKKNIKGAKTNDKVAVEILSFANGDGKKCEGKIIEILGDIYTPGIEETSILYSNGIEINFPAEVLAEVKNMPTSVTEEDIKGRKDLRNERIVTIDGDDSKDYDDAVCVKILENGNYLLGVHIADVSNYVLEGTKLNEEAIKRGTSTYIPGKVIPMLPKELSNGLCSLNEGQDRLTLSIDIEIDKDGNVIQSDVYKAVICSKHRMTYNNVYKIIEDLDDEVKEKYSDYIPDFKLMNELAVILRKRRFEAGSIDFDIPESKVILDEKSEVVDIVPYEITIANKLIEEFMLLANVCIADKMSMLDAPFIYRTHETPDIEKIQTANMVLSMFNIAIKGKTKVHPKAIADVINQIKGHEDEKVISMLILRTMKLAKYSPSNDGHFGLAFDSYCHFTSPIRRYPDLFIHRVISKYLEKQYMVDDKDLARFAKQADEYSISSSDSERQSEKVERDVDDLYKTKYMSNKVGEEYEALVSAVTSFGMFVQLPNTVEGLVSLTSMQDDYYIFDEKKCSLTGEKRGNKYKIGQKVKVKLINTNIQARQIDFILI